MKQIITILLMTIIGPAYSQNCPSLLSSFFETKEERVLNDRGPVKLGSGWGGSVFLEKGKDGQLVTKKVYSADIVKDEFKEEVTKNLIAHFGESAISKPRSLLDLEAMVAFKELANELKSFEVIKILYTERFPSRKASHMEGIIAYMEYAKGIDIKKLWIKEKMTPQISNQYNDLIDEIANFLRANGNTIKIQEVKVQDGLNWIPTGLNQIIEDVTFKNYSGTIMLKPDNFLLGEKGELILIDPY